MVAMTRSPSMSHLGSEFNDFLFAQVGEDRNGMRVSVLSALARRDLDAWQEAAKLAGLPTESATQRLASLIASLPDGPSTHRDADANAARLIALLPRRAGAIIPWRKTMLGVGAVPNSPAAICVISCVMYMVVMIGTQFIMASHPTPAQLDTARAPASSTVSLRTPSPTADP